MSQAHYADDNADADDAADNSETEPLHPANTTNHGEIAEMLLEADLNEVADRIGFVELSPQDLDAIKHMTRHEARHLVDHHWQIIQRRIALNNQIGSFNRGASKVTQLSEPAPCCQAIELTLDVESGVYRCPCGKHEVDPHRLLTWMAGNVERQEAYNNTLVRRYARAHAMGRWAMQFCGIKHGIAATLLAYIDPNKALTAGNVWSICGMNPEQKWLGAEMAEEWVKAQTGSPREILALCAQTFHRRFEPMLRFASTDRKGKPIKLTRDRVIAALALRPWNAKLKTLAYNIGSSFIRVKHSANASVYSRLYDSRRAYAIAKNEAGEYSGEAAKALMKKKNHAQRAIYLKGKLPLGHILSRTRNYIAKQFLADYQQELYRWHFKKEPPVPYPIAYLNHAHIRINPSGPPPGLSACPAPVIQPKTAKKSQAGAVKRVRKQSKAK